MHLSVELVVGAEGKKQDIWLEQFVTFFIDGTPVAGDVDAPATLVLAGKLMISKKRVMWIRNKEIEPGLKNLSYLNRSFPKLFKKRP